MNIGALNLAVLIIPTNIAAEVAILGNVAQRIVHQNKSPIRPEIKAKQKTNDFRQTDRN